MAEELASLIAVQSWDDARLLAARLGVSPAYVAQHHFLALPTQSLTPDLLTELLSAVTDQEWVAAASLRAATESDNVALVDAALRMGLKGTDELARGFEELRDAMEEQEGAMDKLRLRCEEDDAVKRICLLRRSLWELSDKVKTWHEVWGAAQVPQAAAATAPVEPPSDDEDDGGWDELDLPPDASLDPTLVPPSLDSPSLSHFLRQPLPQTATSLAALAKLEPLLSLCLRHSDELWEIRLALLEALPEWVQATGMGCLLPRADDHGAERFWDESNPWRVEPDWVEKLWPTTRDPESLLKREELTDVYLKRVERVTSLGLVDVGLSLVQHGASRGVEGLDAVGEELSLLSKLVYDRPTPPPTPSTSRLPTPSKPNFDDEIYTLEQWRTLPPAKILRSYLAHSTPVTLAADIRRLVLPYLSVLESRLERAGIPDPELLNRLLYDYALELPTLGRLDLLLAIFEASKPTLSRGQRIVKSDEDLARLALACLYGNSIVTNEAQSSIGSIFECLPAFEETISDPSPHSIFELPSSQSFQPSELFAIFQTYSAPSLSHALDALDLHLATSETFLRYSVPVTLSWFITSHSDEKAQRAWATRMARTSPSGGGGKEGDEGEFESEDEWEGLMEDMVALTKDEEEVEEREELKKAFWMLEKEEVLRIFFAGLLACGKFELAKSLLYPSSQRPPLPTSAAEALVIAASREFYDNADSGNLHKGEMKLAFDCLLICPQTPAVKKERDFIEATSRLYSFKIYSRPGVPITPIEVRHSSNRLDFVSRLLASNEDAYRHPDVVLELASKLGYQGDKLAEIRVLSMIADSGLQSGDYARTADVCDRMVGEVEILQKSRSKETLALVEPAAEVTWRNCFQLGKHDDYSDLERRMKLLGQALVLCPTKQIGSLLPSWRILEDHLSTTAHSPSPLPPSPLSSLLIPSRTPTPSLPSPNIFLPSKILPNVVSSETTAAAARAFNRYFPLGQSTKSERDREKGSRATTPASSPLPSPAPTFESPASAAGSVGSGNGGQTSPGRGRTSGEIRDPGDAFKTVSKGGGGLSSRLTGGVAWLIGAPDEMLED